MKGYRNLAGVEDIVSGAVTKFFRRLGECLLRSSDDYNFLAYRKEVFGHSSTNPTTPARDDGRGERESFGCHFGED